MGPRKIRDLGRFKANHLFQPATIHQELGRVFAARSSLRYGLSGTRLQPGLSEAQGERRSSTMPDFSSRAFRAQRSCEIGVVENVTASADRSDGPGPVEELRSGPNVPGSS